ncbi:MAG: hypothetical protein HRU21_13500 [Pseudomonadales bacterium]|nr:hypothetical protein [Pseudomonadales bacterium]
MLLGLLGKVDYLRIALFVLFAFVAIFSGFLLWDLWLAMRSKQQQAIEQQLWQQFTVLLQRYGMTVQIAEGPYDLMQRIDTSQFNAAAKTSTRQFLKQYAFLRYGCDNLSELDYQNVLKKMKMALIQSRVQLRKSS